MALFNDLEYNDDHRPANPEKLGTKAVFLVRTLQFGNSSSSYKVKYFEKLLNFIRVLSLYIVFKNGFDKVLEINERDENRVVGSLLDILFHFNMITIKNGKTILNKKYDRLLKTKADLLQSLIEKDIYEEDSRIGNIFKDFLFVKELIRKYNNHNYPLHFIKKNRKPWSRMISEGELDYEIRLAETLQKLSSLRIPNKIKSPFDEEFYTESGRNAFRNFTQYKFIDVFTDVIQKKDQSNILDIGCGYGNYIDVLSTNYPMFHISGIDSQQNVYEETSRKFNSTPNVEIIHGNFFHYPFQKKFDVVLLNYVLFYFNAREKSELIAKVKEILSENGSIIVCQYFSGIESMKRELADKQKDLSLFKKIEMYYSNKILYANTLWNDVADTFSESVKWDEFLDIISQNDLKINRITNADKFYYSLFIELTQNK